MITNPQQYKITGKALARLRRSYDKGIKDWPRHFDPDMRKPLFAALRGVIQELAQDMRAYEKRTGGKKRLDQANREAPKIPSGIKLTAKQRAAWPNLSRAARWQLIRTARGLCAYCGAEPIVSGRRGAKCLAAQRERMRGRAAANAAFLAKAQKTFLAKHKERP